VSRPPGGSASSAARGAGSAVAKGALLIGLAIVIGLVLLSQVDNDGSKSAATTPGSTKPKATTTTVKKSESSTTTAPLGPAKAPADVSLIVLNGGAPTGDAAKMSTQLKQANYTNQPNDANNWSGHTQQGNTVLCKPGLDREAVALSVAVGQGTQVQPFPTPPPPYSDNVMCVVVVGGTGASSSATTTTTSTG
jgi:hypothetical protein